ncbi:MarR family transcriptional regulator [Actinokineospora sp. HUAS TT18]|uniref:MarR family transcriptional regulator n=1 Tax=Actinokineospora sp. HUAS TT18 TaxID=3447451 RepID=UPI003F526EF8
MSTTTTRTRKPGKARATNTTAGTPTLHPVPDRDAPQAVRTDTEDTLWATLHAHPNSTAAELSAAAGIGKSTAQKILARWATEGSATRTAGIAHGGRRAADLWAITDTTDTPAGTEADTTDPANDPAQSGTPQPAPDNAEPTATTGADDPHAEPVDPPPTDHAPVDGEPGAVASGEPHGTATPEAKTPACPAPGIETTESTDNGADSAPADGAGVKAARLAPGALRGMVEDHLRDHPGQEFSPVEIGRVLGDRSTGAVSNALDKLVTDGVAVRTKDQPRRFALAPTDTSTGSA